MPKPVTTLLSAKILCVLASTGCGETTRVASLPTDLTACAAEPLAPAIPPIDWTSAITARPASELRDKLTFEYVLALRSWGGDCQAKVAGAKAWNDRVGR